MKQEYNRLFDKITPTGSDEEFTLKVLRKAEKMEQNKKTVKFRRPAIALCAAVAAISVGTATAAATGIIDFDRIFGGVITAENEELANVIMGRADNVTTYVSDSNYEIRLNGVTGNDNVIIANLELYRTDGTPIADSFINPYNEDYGFVALDNCKADMAMELENWIGNLNLYSINESGNLEIDVEVSSDLDISEKRITLNGKDLYPIEPYFELLEANNISMWTIDELKWINSSVEEVTLDTSSVAYLQLDWSVGFDYYPSEEALNSIEKSSFTADEKLMLGYSIGEYIDEGKFADIESELVSVKLNSTNGTLLIRTDLKDYTDPETNRIPDILIGDEGNPIRLIRSDGSEVEAFACGAWVHSDETLQLDLVYIRRGTESWYESKMAIDLSDIEAISINGYVYELK